ncbi:MAG: hypothetical protein KJ000_05040 [Pirellulaceae bacterium]|nr:hypothetical protein [Pirellulaceae bacterium]
MRDELNRLRHDLTDVWQRLEDLQQLLDDECLAKGHPSTEHSAEESPLAEVPSVPTTPFNTSALDDLQLEPTAEMDALLADDTDTETMVDAGPADSADEFHASYPASDEDQAIRDYLERLLERVSAERPARTVPLASDDSASESLPVDDEMAGIGSRVPETVEIPEDDSASFEDQPAVAKSTNEESRRRSSSSTTKCGRSGDELAATDLRAMRALANVAAQTVIMEFESKKHAKLALDKLLVMLVCLPCGLLLLYWYSVHRLGLTYIAASIAFFAVALWGCQAIKFFAKVLAARVSLARLWQDRDTPR